MVVVFVRLKLTLLRRTLEAAGIRGRFATAFAILLALVAGGFSGLGLSRLRTLSDQIATDALVAVGAIAILAAVLVALTPSKHQTAVAADNLVLLPLDARKLMPGLLATSMVGFTGLFSVLAATGAVVGMVASARTAALTIAAAVLGVASVFATARLAAASVSIAIRKRRWRDIAVLMGPLLAIFFQVVIRGGQWIFEAESGWRYTVRHVMRAAGRLLPTGPAAMAMGEARAGRNATAVLALIAACAMLAGILSLWALALDRTLTTAADPIVVSRRRRDRFFPRFVPLPSGRAGVVAAKDLKLAWRDPRQRTQLFSGLVPVVLVTAGSLTQGGDLAAVFGPATVAVFMAGQAMNSYGYDGAAHWANVAAGDDAASDLLGKGIAKLVVAGGLSLVVWMIAVALSGPSYAISSLGVVGAALGISVGAGLYVSVIAPVAVPGLASDVYSGGSDPGRSINAFGPGCIAHIVIMLLTAPFGVAAALAGKGAIGFVVGLAGLAGGGMGFRAGYRAAVRRSAGRQPELLADLGYR